MSKRGQMRLSFGMIFSIILIIVFLAFAGYAIVKALGWMKTINAGNFFNSVQEDVDKIWKSSLGSIEKTYNTPSSVEYVCFADFNKEENGLNNSGLYKELQFDFSGSENLFLYQRNSKSDLNSFQLKHIDLQKITENENPFCIKTSKGKVKMTIKMNSGDTLVTITK